MCKRYNIHCKDMLRALYNLDNFSKIERKLIQTCLLLTKRHGHRKLGVESWASKAGHRKLGDESWASKAGRRKLGDGAGGVLPF